MLERNGEPARDHGDRSVPSAGYQGSFHSVPSCFPYGDCYRPAEAAGGEALAGEPHPFHPLRPNGYTGLGAPLPATGKFTCSSHPRHLLGSWQPLAA